MDGDLFSSFITYQPEGTQMPTRAGSHPYFIYRVLEACQDTLTKLERIKFQAEDELFGPLPYKIFLYFASLPLIHTVKFVRNANCNLPLNDYSRPASRVQYLQTLKIHKMMFTAQALEYLLTFEELCHFYFSRQTLTRYE